MKTPKGSKKIPEERNRDKIEVLKSENRKLRKIVQQLRKELLKFKNRDEELQELIEEYDHVREAEQQIEETIPRCPSCNSQHIKILPKLRGNIDYYVCDACSGRGKLNAK